MYVHPGEMLHSLQAPVKSWVFRVIVYWFD